MPITDAGPARRSRSPAKPSPPRHDFAITGLGAVARHRPGTVAFTRGWLSLSGAGGHSSPVAGLLLAIFMFSGWEAAHRRELHDLIGHSISLIAIQAEAAARFARSNPGAVPAFLNAISAASRQALAEMRGGLAVLRPDAAVLPTTGELSPQPRLEQAGTSSSQACARRPQALNALTLPESFRSPSTRGRSLPAQAGVLDPGAELLD